MIRWSTGGLNTIKLAQTFMKKNGIDAWISYDFKSSNPIFWRLIGRKLSTTRRCFLFIPSHGQARLLISSLDKAVFRGLGWSTVEYSSRIEMENEIKSLASGQTIVAMEYSPMCNIPYISRIDAGTVEMLSKMGLKVVSSADIFQYSAARWTRKELHSHMKAASEVAKVKNEAFEFVRKRVRSGKLLTEYDVQSFILQRFENENLVTEHKPIVAVDKNSADPHYRPTENNCAKIEAGDLLMVDLWAKTSKEGVFADMTWMAYLGRNIPDEFAKVFNVVAQARDKVVEHLESKIAKNEPCTGLELDDVARGVISHHGLGKFFTHRTGHSIGTELHSDSLNLDNYESKDTRVVIPGIGFSIEPGIYLENWGIRSEINVFVEKEKPLVTTDIQRSIIELS